MTLRVLVTGGRDYQKEQHVWWALDALVDEHGKITVIEGGAHGADRAAARWATRNPSAVEEHLCYPAKWDEHGKAAGPIRNQQMLDEGMPDLVLAFPGGTGTADQVRRAEASGVEVRKIQ